MRFDTRWKPPGSLTGHLATKTGTRDYAAACAWQSAIQPAR